MIFKIIDLSTVCTNRYKVKALREVIPKVLEGDAESEQIGEQIFISEHMVDNHISDIYEKLNTNKREEAVKIAQQARLII